MKTYEEPKMRIVIFGGDSTSSKTGDVEIVPLTTGLETIETSPSDSDEKKWGALF